MRKDLHEENRLSWNAATDAHNSHKGDQAAFFGNGDNKLHSEEKALLGDTKGLSVAHLQCNSGQDTLSLAQLGAQAVGVDIVFCSYGALCWLSDLHAWARGISAILKPGGRFVTIEYHPALSLFDEQLERKYSYFTNGDVLTWDEGVGDHVGAFCIYKAANVGRSLQGTQAS